MRHNSNILSDIIRTDVLWHKINYTDALIDRKNRIILEWSAKAGCTIGTKLFFRHLGILEEAESYHRWIHTFRTREFYKRYGITRHKDLCSPEFTKIKIVREPFNRAVSSYIHLMKFPEPELCRHAGSSRPDISFKEYLSFISSRNLFFCNPHYGTQYKYYETEGIAFDYIIRLENLERDLDRLNKNLGLNLDATGLTSAHHVRKSPKPQTSAADKKWSELRRPFPAYESFYDAETEWIVANLYSKDFNAYGYSSSVASRGPLDSSYSETASPPRNSPKPLPRLKYACLDTVRTLAIHFRKGFYIVQRT